MVSVSRTAVQFVFSDLGAKWADFETTDNTVTFNVDV
jgi:hypothetical protein